MLRYLFGGLTDRQRPGRALFDHIVAEARRRDWFVAGQVPDTLEGRFAILATVCALAIVRTESGTDPERRSAALTERFVEAMDAEHRQMGMNDPALGKRVRKLVASLARRTAEWREAVAGDRDWAATAESSVYRSGAAGRHAVAHTAKALNELWQRLESASDEQLAEGRF
jgi:cytochrome b pre-mRNA-processing protein 3